MGPAHETAADNGDILAVFAGGLSYNIDDAAQRLGKAVFFLLFRLRDLDELGVILPTDNKPGDDVAPSAAYWNLAGALYADLYIQLARIGIEVVGESQLVGYPSQYPSVSMMNFVTGDPNARFWVLKLLKNHFGPGDRLVETGVANDDLSVQAFETARGRCILVVNKRLKPAALKLPADFKAAHIEYVAPSTGDRPAAMGTVANNSLELEPNEVAVITE